MKRRRHAEPQIVFALQQADSGTPVGGDRAEDGGERGRLLQLEDEIRGHGSGRYQAPEAA